MENRAHQLCMGDVFTRPDGTGRVYGPVLKAYDMGGDLVKVVTDRGSFEIHAWASITLTKRVRCSLGIPVDLCDHGDDCTWPDEAEELWKRYIATLR